VVLARNDGSEYEDTDAAAHADVREHGSWAGPSGGDPCASLDTSVPALYSCSFMRHQRVLLGVLTAAVSLTMFEGHAHADMCPAPNDAPGVASIDAQQRLDYLARAFDEEVRTTDIWSWTLGSAFTVGAVAQASLIPAYPFHASNVDLSVGSVSMGVAALTLWVLPLQITLPLRDARKHWNDGGQCEALARAERTLASVQKDQARATGVVPHVVNILANTGIMLILGLGYDHWKVGIVSGFVGTGIGEGNALTQPSNLGEVLARYRSGQLDALTPPVPKVAWGVVPTVNQQMAGASFALSW